MWLFQMSRRRRSGARRQSQVLAVSCGISFETWNAQWNSHALLGPQLKCLSEKLKQANLGTCERRGKPTASDRRAFRKHRSRRPVRSLCAAVVHHGKSGLPTSESTDSAWPRDVGCYPESDHAGHVSMRSLRARNGHSQVRISISPRSQAAFRLPRARSGGGAVYSRASEIFSLGINRTLSHDLLLRSRTT